jgi:erythromycin esterase
MANLELEVQNGRMSGMTKTILTIIAVLSSLAALAQGTVKPGDLQTQGAWLRDNAVPVKTVVAQNGFEDLESLSSFVGDAKIIGLGEATHGTREFFQMKHRLLEYLVERQGFGIFAIEASWASSLEVNEYVLGGPGDGKALLQKYARVMWPWRTQEVLELIQWMRAYNASNERKVMFTGFDMQEPVPAVDWLATYLETTAPR